MAPERQTNKKIPADRGEFGGGGARVKKNDKRPASTTVDVKQPRGEEGNCRPKKNLSRRVKVLHQQAVGGLKKGSKELNEQKSRVEGSFRPKAKKKWEKRFGQTLNLKEPSTTTVHPKKG